MWPLFVSYAVWTLQGLALLLCGKSGSVWLLLAAMYTCSVRPLPTTVGFLLQALTSQMIEGLSCV